MSDPKKRETVMDDKYHITEVEDKSPGGNYTAVFHHTIFSKRFGTDEDTNPIKKYGPNK